MNYLVIMWSLVMVNMSDAVAQTLTTDAPLEQKTWEILLKLAFPVLMTAVGPMLTQYMKTMPPVVKYLVASLGSMVVGAGAGAIPDFPLSIESGATIGVTSGAIGQKLFMMQPKE